MDNQLPVIVVLTPLLTAILVTLFGLWRPSFAFPLTILGLALTLAASVRLVEAVAADPTRRLVYELGGWSGQPPVGIHLVVDPLSAIVVLVIAFVSVVAGIYSLCRVPEETPGKVAPYYTLFLLLTTGLIGICVAADSFNVFVMLEVSSLTSYALVAMGKSRQASIAAFRYVIMGTIGASFYLLGVGYLYAKTGALNIEEIRSVIEAQQLAQSPSVHLAFVLIMTGLFVKMAFFPLHGWLTNAYTFSPSTSACLMAPLVTKVSLYVMVRMIWSLFGFDFAFESLDWSRLIVWLAVLAIAAGSILAFAQKNLKPMLCFLVIAEVGYMVGALWLGSEAGLTASVFHLVSDAAMTLCLFLAAGIFWRATRTHEIASLSHLLPKMPWTSTAFLAGAFSMIGIPPTCGFFSKWYLIRAGIESAHWEYVVALLVSSLVNALLFFRVIEVMFFGKDSSIDSQNAGPKPVVSANPAPPMALLSLWIAAAAVIAIGVFNSKIVELIRSTFTGVPLQLPS